MYIKTRLLLPSRAETPEAPASNITDALKPQVTENTYFIIFILLKGCSSPRKGHKE